MPDQFSLACVPQLPGRYIYPSLRAFAARFSLKTVHNNEGTVYSGKSLYGVFPLIDMWKAVADYGCRN